MYADGVWNEDGVVLKPFVLLLENAGGGLYVAFPLDGWRAATQNEMDGELGDSQCVVKPSIAVTRKNGSDRCFTKKGRIK